MLDHDFTSTNLNGVALHVVEPAPAVEHTTDYANGFELRFREGPRPCLNWQAGVSQNEHRNYRDPGMFSQFCQTVTLFYLLGYGTTREEAIDMAIKNANGRGKR